jgi:hypothetical protein
MARRVLHRHGMRRSYGAGDDIARGYRREVVDIMRPPDIMVKSLEREEPAVAMSPADAADLGRCRRSVEPLRIVVMPQHHW